MLPLHLIYNPNGTFLPGPQKELEADYKRELKDHFGIVFNQLFTITNLPIGRFASWLKNNGQLADYMALLNNAFNPATVNVQVVYAPNPPQPGATVTVTVTAAQFEITTPPVIAAFRAAGVCGAGACRVPISSGTAMRYEGPFVE